MSLIAATTSSNKQQCTGNVNIVSNNNFVIDMEITKTPKPNLSISSVSGLTPETEPETSLSMQCSKNWKKIQETLRLEEKENKKRIETYVKHHLFKDIKFIPDEDFMRFSLKKNSLNYLVCSNLNVATEDHPSFWAKYSQHVAKTINVARNDAVQSMKKAFLKGM